MLTQRQIRQACEDHQKVVFPVLLAAMVLSLLSLPVSFRLARYFNFPALVPITLIVIGFSVQLSFLMWPAYRKKLTQIRIFCPFCNAPYLQELILKWAKEFRIRRTTLKPLTGFCPKCEKQVLDYPAVSQAARERLSAHQTWVCLQRIHWYLWGFVLLQFIFVYGYYFSHLSPYYIAPEKFALSLFGLGIDVCSIFLWFRSGNPRCIYPCIISTLLTAYMFINAWTDFTASTVR